MKLKRLSPGGVLTRFKVERECPATDGSLSAMRQLRMFCRDVPDISQQYSDYDRKFPPDNPTTQSVLVLLGNQEKPTQAMTKGCFATPIFGAPRWKLMNENT